MSTITNNFNDVMNLVRMAYDYYYNQNTTLCYDVKPVNLTDVDNIQSIKRILNNTQSAVFVNSVLNDKLQYIKNVITPYGRKYIMKKISDPYSVDLSFFIYTNDENNNLSSSQNINKRMMKLLSDLLTNDVSQHILLQILNIDVQLMDIEELINNYSELKSLMPSDNIQNKIVSIGITEHFFKMMTLADYLDDGLLSKWKSLDYITLIFQIIHTLAVIQNRYPTFRHNNLNIKYIDGYVKNINAVLNKYDLDGTTFNVPNIGFIYKMSNLEYSTIVDIVINENIDDNLRSIDKMYDAKTFLTSLKKHLEKVGSNIPDDIHKFIDKTISSNDEISPLILLNDKIFDVLKEMNENKTPNKIKNKRMKEPSKYNYLNKKKVNIIENKNKISMQKLTNNMVKPSNTPSFLWKATRQLGSNSIKKDNFSDEFSSEGGGSVKSKKLTGKRSISNKHKKISHAVSNEDKKKPDKELDDDELFEDNEEDEEDEEEDDEEDEDEDEDEDDKEEEKKLKMSRTNKSKKYSKAKRIEDDDSLDLKIMKELDHDSELNKANKNASTNSEGPKMSKMAMALRANNDEIKRAYADLENANKMPISQKPQMSQMPKQMPQLMPQQMSPQMPQSMSPQMPLQMSPQMSPQMPPQMHQEMPQASRTSNALNMNMNMNDMAQLADLTNMSQMGPMGPMGPMGSMGQMGQMGQMGPMGPMGQMSPMSPMGMGQMSPMVGMNQMQQRMQASPELGLSPVDTLDNWQRRGQMVGGRRQKKLEEYTDSNIDTETFFFRQKQKKTRS